MIEWTLKHPVEPIKVRLKVKGHSDRAAPTIAGAEDQVARVRGLLATVTGAHGHALPEQCTDFELWLAMQTRDFEEYAPVMTQGVLFAGTTPPLTPNTES